MTIQAVLADQASWRIECAEAIAGLNRIPDGVIHCAVTSPPYYGLRKYGKDSEELGGEKRPDCLGWATGSKCGCCYVCRLTAVCEEVRRVLRDDGTFWLNLGDSYWGSWGNYSGGNRGNGCQRPIVNGSLVPNEAYKGNEDVRPPTSYRDTVLKPGDLIGIPWRVALALQAAGWYLRADCCWIKLAPMPSSFQGWRWERCQVKHANGKRSREKKAITTEARPPCGRASNGKDFDSLADWSDCPGCEKCEANGGYVLRRGSWRLTTAHEYLFLFAKSQRYYADGYAVRQRLAEATIMRDRYTRVLDDPDEQYAVSHDHESISDPDLGANLRSWLIFQGEQFQGKHYAVFPPSLPALAIKCGTSEAGVCPDCGSPWARVAQRKTMTVREGPKAEGYREASEDGAMSRTCVNGTMIEPPSATTLGWRQTCECEEHEPIPAIVLDPFCGAGTTVLAARRLNRRAIGLELYKENVELARKRIADDLPLFNL